MEHWERIKALREEIQDRYNDEELETLYIGGGTPSSLNISELNELFDILKDRGADLLIETIDKVSKNEIERKKQDDKLSTHASMLNKEMAHIDWNKSSKQIHDLIRGMNPWPIAYTDYNGDKMKVFKSSFNGDKCTQKPGTILKADKKGIYVATGDGTLIIEKLQLPNGKPLEVSQFLNGHDIERGTIFK